MMRSRETNVGKHEECIGSLKIHITGKEYKKKLFSLFLQKAIRSEF